MKINPTNDYVTGDATGLTIPITPDALLHAGPEFLTSAFRAFGALGEDNAVTRIVSAEPCHAGNSGQKLALVVAYARPDPGLDTQLFAKFSRFMHDPHRDFRRFELEPEVRLAALSRHPGFPIAVAKPYFADFDHASGSGVLISQRIAFGVGNIEPAQRKCMDHELSDPLERYRLTITTLARLAAAGKAGKMSPELERMFPYDPAEAAAALPIPWTEQGLREAMARLRDFAASAPHLWPPNVTLAFLHQLEQDAVDFLHNQAAVRRFLFADPDYVALLHWNTHLDNAWFWRNAAGALQCGLLDWGMVRHMNVTTAIWGGVSCMEPYRLDENLAAMISLFSDQLQANGGPKLDRAKLDLHFDLSTAMIGMAMLMDMAAVLLGRMPNIAEASGVDDPMLSTDQVVHGFHLCAYNFLSTWQQRDFGESLRGMLKAL
jgi:hypothetical protein